MKISNFEFGTVKISKDKASIQIPKSEFKYDSLKELNDIKNQEDNFLKLIDIKEIDDKSRVEFNYEIPKGVIPFYKLKKEELIVRLSIAKTILEDDKLNNSDMYVSIHPSTLFYHPMSTVKYMYQANRLMPQEQQFSDFERYKAIVLSIVSGLPYDICLKNKERVLKTKNNLVASIIETKSREELLNDLEKLLEYKQYSYFQESKRKKNSKKIKAIVFSTAGLILLLLAVGITKSIANKEHVAAVANYEQQIKEKDEMIKTHEYLSKGEYELAAKSMKKAGSSDEEIADMFLDANLYQEALDANPKHLEKIIEKLYAEDKKDTIIELKMNDSPELELEKKIVAYDYAELKSQMAFVENPKTAFRMGKAFADHGNIEDARMLQERLQDKELDRYITLKEKESELQKNKEALEKVQKEKEKEKDENKKKDLENQEKTIHEKIQSLEKEIKDLNK